MKKTQILYVGRNLDIERKVVDSFSGDIQYRSVRSTTVASEMVKSGKFHVVVIDEKIATDENYREHKNTDLSKIYHDIIEANVKTTIIILYDQYNTYFKNFKKLNNSTVLFNRNHFNPSRLAFCFDFLKRQEFRTIYTKDLLNHTNFPVDMYNVENEQFVQLAKQGEKIDYNNIASYGQLYGKSDDFPVLLNSKKRLPITETMNEVRKRFKTLIVNLVDDSHLGDISAGKKIKENGNWIIEKIISISEKGFSSTAEACEEFPYRRNSLLSHGINSAIYMTCFAKICSFENKEELAWSALIHDIGLSFADFHRIKKHKGELTYSDLVGLTSHVEEASKLIRNKMISLEKLSEEVIMQHHENLAGEGFPFGLTEKELGKNSRLIQIVDSFERLRVSMSLKQKVDIYEVIRRLSQKKSIYTDIHYFCPEILDDLEVYFRKAKQIKTVA